MSCKKAQEVLGSRKISVAELVDARKVRLGRKEALKLARSVEHVVAVKGKKVVRFDLKKSDPSDAELAAELIGPSGNLRAPALRMKKTLLVGFNADVYRDLFQGR